MRHLLWHNDQKAHVDLIHAIGICPLHICAGPQALPCVRVRVIYSRREARIDLCDFLLQNTTAALLNGQIMGPQLELYQLLDVSFD